MVSWPPGGTMTVESHGVEQFADLIEMVTGLPAGTVQDLKAEIGPTKRSSR